MTTLYTILISFTVGFAAALLLILYTQKPRVEQHVNKIKQKGGPGNEMDTVVEFKNIADKEATKAEKKEKRELNKAERQLKRSINNLKQKT